MDDRAIAKMLAMSKAPVVNYLFVMTDSSVIAREGKLSIYLCVFFASCS